MKIERRISRNAVLTGIKTGMGNRRCLLAWVGSAMLSFLLVACDGYRISGNGMSVLECVEPEQFDGALSENQVVLCQNWNAEQRLDFWFRPQGSQIIPYDWFLALEQPGNEKDFIDNDHMDALGYLPQLKTNKHNPDGLPIGFTKDRAKGNKDYSRISGEWLGITCAACHTNQIDFGGKQMVVDGAPTMGDFEVLMWTLVDSMEMTLDNPAKFNRFAEKVFKLRNSEADSPEELREQLKSIIDIRQKWNDRNKGESPYGYARLDAIGAIFNEISFAAGGESNLATAPVSYPFIWDTPHHDKVQWNSTVVS